MAQHLAVALKATLVIAKKVIFQDRIPAEIAIETVKNNYDLSLYSYSETEHFHLWKLKDEILETEIVPFLEAVFKFYYKQEESSFEIVIGEIGRRKDYDSIFKVAKGAEYEHFELENKQNAQFHLKKYGKHLQVNFNYFQLFKGDRLRMDGFDNVMLFLQDCMRKTFSKFELSKILDVYILESK